MCIKIVQMLDVEFISKENWNTVSFEQISKKRSKKTKTHFHFFCFLVFSSHNINFMFFRLFTKSTQCTYLRRDIGSRKKKKEKQENMLFVKRAEALPKINLYVFISCIGLNMFEAFLLTQFQFIEKGRIFLDQFLNTSIDMIYKRTQNHL